jgi:hypothetical protein
MRAIQKTNGAIISLCRELSKLLFPSTADMNLVKPQLSKLSDMIYLIVSVVGGRVNLPAALEQGE